MRCSAIGKTPRTTFCTENPSTKVSAKLQLHSGEDGIVTYEVVAYEVVTYEVVVTYYVATYEVVIYEVVVTY